MAYTPPAGNLLDFNISGNYTPPKGDEVVLQFGSVLDNYIRTFDVILGTEFESLLVTESELIRTHTVDLIPEFETCSVEPLIHMVTNTFELSSDIEHSLLQILPDIVTHPFVLENGSDLLLVGGNSETDLPMGISPGHSFKYGGATSADIYFKFRWGVPAETDVCYTIGNRIYFEYEDTFKWSPWEVMFVLDQSAASPWEDLVWFDVHYLYPWASFFIQDITHKTDYYGNKFFSIESNYSYAQPEAKDVLRGMSYGWASYTDPTREFDWNVARLTPDSSKEVPWGPRELFKYCYREYIPPQQGDIVLFSFPPKNNYYPVQVESTRENVDLFNARMLAALEQKYLAAYVTYQGSLTAEDTAYSALLAASDYLQFINSLPHADRPESSDSALSKYTLAEAEYLRKQGVTVTDKALYEKYKYDFDNYIPVEALPDSNNTVLDYSILLSLSHYSADPRCLTEHNRTGPRDSGGGSGTIVIPPEPPFPPFAVKQVYYVMNTVLVKTLPGNVDIEVRSVSMTIDRDSWLWQLSMTVAKKEYVDLLSPKNGVYQTVEIYINGWRWVFLIESWSENLGFAKGTYSVSGRSPSLVLGDPICDKKSFTNTSEETGSSIITGILGANPLASGFSIAFSDYTDNQTGFDPNAGSHWLISENAFSYTGQTDIQAIQTLAESIGGYVQTHRSFYDYGGGNDYRILEILPRFKFQPWNWTASYPGISYKQLDKSIIREIGTSYKKNPDYYGAYIVGESPRAGGTTSVFCNVYKDGKGAATLHAPLCSGPLFTTDEIAQEKGRMIIGDSGVWSEHTIKIFSLMPSGTAPGLLKVGDMINVTSGATTEWRGLVTSVAIDAGVINTSAFSVSQTISVSQYIGEWNG